MKFIYLYVQVFDVLFLICSNVWSTLYIGLILYTLKNVYTALLVSLFQPRID